MLKKCPFLFILLAVGMASAATLDIPEYLFVEQDLEGCYLLKDKYDLYWFANKVNTENTTYATACAKLTADIVVNEHVLTDAQGTECVGSTGSYEQCSDEFRNSLYDWTPIGIYNSKPFKGTFDGLGHTISGLYDGREVSYTGLFGYVSGTNAKVSIKNVGVEDSYFRVKNYAGGIVGLVYGGSGVLNIENVYNASTFYIIGSGYVGGLIGRVGANWTLNITNAYNSGSIFVASENTTANYVAGLVGCISSSATVKNAFNYGNLYGNLNGYAPLVNSNATVTNSFYLGDAAQGSYGVNKSASDFSDGTVLNLLKDGENGFVWQSGSPNPTLLINSHKADLVYLGDAVSRGLIYFIEGFGYAKSLPTIHLDGSPILGWYENQSFTGTKYTEIPADVKRDLQLYPKLYKPVGGCYEISDADELYAYASIVNGTLVEGRDAEPTACGKLTADIVVNENVLGTNNANVNADGSYNGTAPVNVWTPIGNSTNKFQGSFNGQGHTISGLYFNNPDADNVGLFGYTSGAVTIDNVGVVDSYFLGENYVGSVVGQAESTGSGKLLKELTVIRSYNKGFVKGTSNVGGLVGKNGNVQFSYNTGSVTGTSNVGGLVGSNVEKTNIFEINGSYNVGLVKMGTGSGNAVLGEGCPTGSSQSGTVKNVYYLEGAGDACLGAHSKTSYEFADGFVAITLHDDRTVTGANIWGQVVGADKTPTLTGEIRFLLKDGCFEIANEEDLYFFAAAVNNGVDSKVCVKLTADIKVNENVLKADGTLNGDGSSFTPWTPIGTWNTPFEGSFYGQGHTISGLYFNDIKTDDVGLFGDVSGTVTIDGVGLVDSYIGGKRCVGGLVGYASGSLTISDSYNASSVNTPGSGFGGLVGAAGGIYDGEELIEHGLLTISNSYNEGSLNGNKWGGGLVGYADALVVSNSYNAGSMHIGGSGEDAYIGGITSSVDNASTVTNSYNYGEINYPTENSVSKDDLVPEGGEGVVVTVTNSFTIGTSRFEDNGSTKKSEDEFADGTVFAALRNAEDGEVWRQYKNDAYPTFAAKTGTGAPAPMHVAVLHYSETDSVVIAYTEGTTFTLPTKDKSGNPIAGWTTSSEGTGDVITEIPTSATTDLKLYPKVKTFEPNADGYYEIATADDFYKFAEIVNNGTVPDAKAKLVADIVVNEHVLADANGVSKVDSDGAYIGADSASFRKWTPIGNSTNKFQGTFDGQGHTISGLYVNEPQTCPGECPNNVNIGLFGAVANATDDGTVFIRNVGVEDSYFAGHSHIGGIVGDFNSEGNLNIENSYSVATIYAAAQSGGLAGYIQHTNVKIEDSYSYGNFKCNSECGALVGTDYSLTMDVANSYYLEGVKSKFGTAASSDAFANGTVATLLHGDGTGANSLWGQNVTDGESHPTFFKGINVVGPGVIAGGPETSTITLLYPDATDSSFTYVEGWGASLPEKDKNGDYVIWYDGSGNFYNEISSTVSGDLVLHAVVFKPGNDGFYEIDDVAKLYKFAAIVNGGNGDVNAKLTADIEVNKNVLATAGGKPNVDATTGAYTGNTTGLREWTPIGYCDENLNCLPFTGIFDGQGHTISGLYYNDENANEVGLFGYVEGDGSTIIKNVGVEDSYFKALDIAGGILGEYGGENAASIENVYSAAVVVAGEDARAGIGGVVGTAWYGDLTVTNAYNVGSVIGGGSMGGIVGDIEECSATIKNSFNYGNVAGEPLVGSVDGEDVSVTNSYYLADEVSGSYGSNASASDFENGTVLAALRDGEGGYVWVQAEGDKYPTIDVNASTNAKTIVLDWTSAADSTTLDAAGYTDGAMVIVKDGKQFYAGGAIYEGILSAGQVAAIGGNKLYPISGVELETDNNSKLIAILDGNSKDMLLIPTEIPVDKVVYKRDISANDAFVSIMLPFKAPLTSFRSEYTFYKFKRMAENDNGRRYVVKVSSVKEDFLANTPYITKPPQDAKQIHIVAEAEGLVLQSTIESPYEISTTTTDGVKWTMKGVYEYKTWETGDSELGKSYGFAAQNMNDVKIGEFAKLGAGASILPMRMYLVKEMPTQLARPGFANGVARINELPETIAVEFEDEEEGTMLVKRITVAPTVIKSNSWFDMKGRSLGGKPTAKGTYYHNGQKIIIK